MGIIELYLIFALTTSITCCILFFLPVLGEIRSQGVINEFTQHPIISTIIFIGVSCILAPFLILPILFEARAEDFKRGLRKSIVEKD